MKQGSLWIALVVLCVLGNAACGGNSHHTPPVVPTNNFVFYAAGTDSTGLTYSIAGSVQISADGHNTIIGGVQDFNDGNADTGIGTSPQPSGDLILPKNADGSIVSTLSFFADGSGNATLTLVTNNPNLGVLSGVDGVETFALSFANPKHALIAEFDGTATSLGSYDQQTLPTSAFAGSSFSFTVSGVDPEGFAIAEGGVFSLDGSGTITGTADVNDGGAVTVFDIADVTLGSTSLGSFGRGTVQGSLDGITTTVNYYIVSPEVIRLVNVDATDTAVGSAYGQGTAQGTFTNSSIGTSVFSVAGVDDLVLYNIVGQFNTVPTEDSSKPANLRGVHPNGEPILGTFSGVADVNESVDGGPTVTDQAFNGTYNLATDGRGSFNFTLRPTDDIAAFGVYAVDPQLNILDPNNSVAGLVNGALIVELDGNLIGNGLLIPQVSSAGPVITDIAADVVFGAQGNGIVEPGPDQVVNEFELLGAAATDGGLFAGEGFIDDPFGIITGTVIGDANSTFNATFSDDSGGIGRYTSGEAGFVATTSTDEQIQFTVTIYDANGKQLFWIETDSDFTWGGSIQASTFTVPVAGGKAPAKPKNK
jgi:hypothetical protein